MSSFKCGKCSKTSVIWPALTGGADKLAEELNVPLLAKVPIDPEIGKACDEGVNPFLDSEQEKNEIMASYLKIAEAVQAKCQ